MMGSIAFIYIRVQWRRERNGIRGETEGYIKKAWQERGGGEETMEWKCGRRVKDGVEEFELKTW